MMSNEIKVNGLSDIPAAVESSRKYAALSEDGSAALIFSLVCEEILLRLVNGGCAEVTISLKRLGGRSVELRARGGRVDVSRREAEGREDGITSEISSCLLAKYADYYDYRYIKGVNIYRIYTAKKSLIDLTDEIYAFYRDESGRKEKEKKPAAVLRYIAGKHRGFLVFSVFVLLMRHLAALMLPVFASNIINTVTENGSFFVRPVMVNLLASAAALLVNLVCYWIDSRCYRRFTRAVEAGFRMALVQKLQVLSMKFHNSKQSGKVLSKLVSDVQFIQILIYDRFLEILLLCEDVVFIIVVALTSFPMMLLFYALIIPGAVILLRRFSRPLLDRRAELRRETEQANAAVMEMLEMTNLTRSHGLEKTEYRSILGKVRGIQKASVSYDRQTVSLNDVTYGVFQSLRLVSLCLAAYLTATGHIRIGLLVLFQSIFDLIISNVQRLMDAVPQITQGYDSLISVNEILWEQDIESCGTVLLPDPVRGEIEFRHVSFRYSPDQEPVLKDVSFHVPAGGSAAFVGKSGDGKSTILNLITGLYNADGGEVLIDGLNVNTLDKTAYRHKIGLVPQNPVLFSGSLWDNLVYGLSYVSPDRVMEVIRSVGLKELLDTLPDGLSSPVFENGANLSGGQRQRISIARALLREPRIILLDEVTSALDAESEQQVQHTIDSIMHNCTVILVAHRLNTVKNADVIYEIRDGKAFRYDSFGEYADLRGGTGIEPPGSD